MLHQTVINTTKTNAKICLGEKLEDKKSENFRIIKYKNQNKSQWMVHSRMEGTEKEEITTHPLLDK